MLPPCASCVGGMDPFCVRHSQSLEGILFELFHQCLLHKLIDQDTRLDACGSPVPHFFGPLPFLERNPPSEPNAHPASGPSIENPVCNAFLGRGGGGPRIVPASDSTRRFRKWICRHDTIPKHSLNRDKISRRSSHLSTYSLHFARSLYRSITSRWAIQTPLCLQQQQQNLPETFSLDVASGTSFIQTLLVNSCICSVSLIHLLLFGSRDPRRGNEERDQHICSGSCNGENENIFDTDHVCLQHKSELLSAEGSSEARRASLADATRSDLWSCGCQPFVYRVLEDGLCCRVEVGAADGLARCPRMSVVFAATAEGLH